MKRINQIIDENWDDISNKIRLELTSPVTCMFCGKLMTEPIEIAYGVHQDCYWTMKEQES